MNRWKIYAGLCVALFTLLPSASHADATGKARRMYNLLTGLPPRADDPAFQSMVTLVQKGDTVGAAAIATSQDGFLNFVLRRMASQMSNGEENPVVPLNDFIATFIGIARDDIDARKLLTTNLVYQADPKIVSAATGYQGTCGTLPCDIQSDQALLVNGVHYSALDDYRVNLAKVLVPVPQRAFTAILSAAVTTGAAPSSPPIVLPDTAGVLTSAQWSAEHFDMGTNRRVVQYAFQEFLCREVAQTVDFLVPETPTGIRRDVDRLPGGLASNFKTSCLGCHGQLDAMAGATCYFENGNGKGTNGNYVRYQKGTVQAKCNKNANVFPTGHQVIDDSWVNKYIYNGNTSIGWSPAIPTTGRGMAALGNAIANTDAFAKCMASRAFQEMCKRPPDPASETATITQIADDFKNNNYNLKRLFGQAAAQTACSGK